MLKYKDFLSTYVKNNNSIYPVINGTKYSEKKLEFIYNYLLSEKNINNKEKECSDFIKKAIEHNKNIKNKKLDAKQQNKRLLLERKKIGRSNRLRNININRKPH